MTCEIKLVEMVVILGKKKTKMRTNSKQREREREREREQRTRQRTVLFELFEKGEKDSISVKVNFELKILSNGFNLRIEFNSERERETESRERVCKEREERVERETLRERERVERTIKI